MRLLFDAQDCKRIGGRALWPLTTLRDETGDECALSLVRHADMNTANASNYFRRDQTRSFPRRAGLPWISSRKLLQDLLSEGQTWDEPEEFDYLKM